MGVSGGASGESAVGAGALCGVYNVWEEDSVQITVEPNKTARALPVKAPGFQSAASTSNVGPPLGGPEVGVSNGPGSEAFRALHTVISQVPPGFDFPRLIGVPSNGEETSRETSIPAERGGACLENADGSERVPSEWSLS